jgi:hypothetical protein
MAISMIAPFCPSPPLLDFPRGHPPISPTPPICLASVELAVPRGRVIWHVRIRADQRRVPLDSLNHQSLQDAA